MKVLIIVTNRFHLFRALLAFRIVWYCDNVEGIPLGSSVWYVMSLIAVFSSLRTRLSMLASVFTCVLDERCFLLFFSADKLMSCLQVWVFSFNRCSSSTRLTTFSSFLFVDKLFFSAFILIIDFAFLVEINCRWEFHDALLNVID